MTPWYWCHAMIPGIMYGVLPPEPFDLVDEAVDFIQKENIDLILPTGDDVATLSQNRGLFSCELFISDYFIYRF